MKVKIICQYCGKEVETWPAYQSRRKFCNMECKARSQGHPPVSGTCDQCGAEITGRRYTKWIKTKNHFCSPECHDAFRRIPLERLVPSKSHAWKRYARTIRAEVGDMCVLCSQPKESMQMRRYAHHIVPYTMTKDNSRDNLCCLCNGCHRTVERMIRNDLSFYLHIFAPFLQERQRYFREETLRTL